MRIDPDPGGSELQLLGQYLDNQRETVLLKSDGLSDEQLVQKLPPSDITLGGGQNMPVAPGHHLLPHERWSASFVWSGNAFPGPRPLPGTQPPYTWSRTTVRRE